MKGIFVTGTDTGVGKSVVTGLIARRLQDEGHSVITQKWIETGTKGFSKDITKHLRMMGRRKRDVEHLSKHLCPYSFKFPSSPHLAARLEKKKISAQRIKGSFRYLQKKFDYVIVEGAGGALVPYSPKKLLIDIAKDLGLPVVIVAENKLGAINHTLLTIEALRKRRMKISGVIFNNWRGRSSKRILDDNMDIVKKRGQVFTFNLTRRMGMRQVKSKDLTPFCYG